MDTYKSVESTQEESDFIDNNIRQYNQSVVPYDLSIPLSKLNRNIKDENGNIIAGINCSYDNNPWNCIYIEVLWVNDEYREKKLGSQLLIEVEEIAKEYACHLIYLVTFGFQAKNFYIKHGYEVFGVLENCPLGHNKYYLKKDL